MPTTRPLNICIATCDVQGPVRNGGIGTAYSNLAKLLVSAGHHVTLLYISKEYCEHLDVTHWKKEYKKIGIRFVPMPDNPRTVYARPFASRSYEAYQWLKERHFDIIHFHEMQGSGYYSLLARKQGIAFQNTILCVGLHSPTLWHQQSERTRISQEGLASDFLERKSVEHAEVLISPSKYMLNYLKSEDWKLPKNVQVLQNVFLPRVLAKPAHQGREIKEIIFFGRLELRKGLAVFCQAIDLIAPLLQSRDIKVIFMGKKAKVEGNDSLHYLSRRTAHWPFQINFQIAFDTEQALRYMLERNTLAVLPSLVENSPYTVIECLSAGIPCIASNVGGIPELVHPKDRERILFAPDTANLRRKLSEILENGDQTLRPAKLSCTPEQTAQHWLDWHVEAGKMARKSKAKKTKNKTRRQRNSRPRISVCIPHRNRPYLLKNALDSLKAQDFSDFEVLIVDDGSDDPKALKFLKSLEKDFKKRGWRILHQERRFGGAARNHAARKARGEYLLFMDDDNEAEPFELRVFDQAVRRMGCDILTCGFNLVYDDEDSHFPRSRLARSKDAPLWMPLGAALALGFFVNCFGDTNALVKRDVFLKLNGFAEDYGVSHEDWEFFARAVLKGYKLEIVPEGLFWYRRHLANLSVKTSLFQNRAQSMRPYLQAVEPELRPLLLLAQEYGEWMCDARISFSNALDENEKASSTLFHTDRTSRIFRVDEETGYDLLDHLNVNVLEKSSGFKFDALTEDPIILFPAVELSSHEDIIVQVSLTAPHPTFVELFYMVAENPEYSQSRKLERRVGAGKREIHFRLPQANHTGQLRLDPGETRGVFIIHSIEIRSANLVLTP